MSDRHDEHRRQDNARDLDAIRRVVDRIAEETHANSHKLTEIEAKLDGVSSGGEPSAEDQARIAALMAQGAALVARLKAVDAETS